MNNIIMASTLAPAPDDIERLEARANEVGRLLKTLSHPNRIRIACVLMGAECSVSELENRTGVRQPVLSRELARMRSEGLVAARRESKMVFYRLSDDRLGQVLTALCGVFGKEKPERL